MRIEQLFSALNKKKKTGFISYIMAGDPDQETSLELLKKLPACGVDLIELGMPFTDPVADGPTIEQAARRALHSGIKLRDICQMVKTFRKQDDKTPIILMGYYNPICHVGVKAFVKQVKAAGVDGLLIVDLPPEEDSVLLESCDQQGIALVKLVTPTTDDKRLALIANKARGFVYYVSVAGITGSHSGSKESIRKAVKHIRKYTDLPVAVGFGIKTAEDIKALDGVVDAVVVGSAIVDKLARSKSVEEVEQFVKSLGKV